MSLGQVRAYRTTQLSDSRPKLLRVCQNINSSADSHAIVISNPDKILQKMFIIKSHSALKSFQKDIKIVHYGPTFVGPLSLPLFKGLRVLITKNRITKIQVINLI